MIEIPEELFKDIFHLLVIFADYAYGEDELDVDEAKLIDKLAQYTNHRTDWDEDIGITRWMQEHGLRGPNG